jgi:hypothetical protein
MSHVFLPRNETEDFPNCKSTPLPITSLLDVVNRRIRVLTMHVDISMPITVTARSEALRSLECWNRGFESHSRHGCLCAFILFIYLLFI